MAISNDKRRRGRTADNSPVALIHVDDSAPGIRRRRRGRGFIYLDAHGKPVTDAKTLRRIRDLAIPPAYQDVWICADRRGHVQTTGRDARGRKQYRYHPAWRTRRDHGKFRRLAAFGAAMPALRKRLRHDLARRGLPREKVLAVVVCLLGQTLARVGNSEYARDNHSYGLTTLRERHIAFLRKGRVRLRFRGKSGKEHELTVDDARLARLLRRCHELPGQALFQYLDEDEHRQPVDSGMVNDYLRANLGDDFTTKDFRTWGATALAVVALAREPVPMNEGAAVAAQSRVVRYVASVLGNTPAVCRASYIHPGVFETWRSGGLPDADVLPLDPHKLERLVLKIVRSASRARPRQ